MAQSQVVGVANAVVGFLPLQTYTGEYSVTAGNIKRRWRPIYDVSELSQLTLTVTPGGDVTDEQLVRKAKQLTWEVWLHIQKVVANPDDLADLDELDFLTEEIKDHLRFAPRMGDGKLIGIVHSPLLNPEMLEADSLYHATLTLQYRYAGR